MEKFIYVGGKSPKNPVIQDIYGFTYAKTHVSRVGNNISWRCSKKKRGCKAYVTTCGPVIIQRKHHPHACEIDPMNVLEVQ